MIPAESPTFSMLERYLEVAAYRQGVVAGNIANIDTPGYHTRDLDFQAALQTALGGDAALAPQVREVNGLVQRPDGNNVSLERESMLLAETQLQFRTGIQLLRSQFQRLKTAINGGQSS